MEKNRKRICINFFLVLLISVLFVQGCYAPQKKQTSSTSSYNEKNQTETNQEFQDYTVYESDEIPFRFVIAHIVVKENEGTNLSFHDFVTSEGIYLDDLDSYVSQLEENDYYLGKKSVWLSLGEKQNSFDGNIFFPVLDRSLEKIELNAGSVTFSFDLTKNEGNIQELLYKHETDTISDQDTYQFRVTDLFEITGETMYQNDEELVLPSSARVLAIKVEAVSLNGKVNVIDSASLQVSDGEEIDAESLEIHSMKYENLIGKQIKEQEEGCLFFLLMDPDHSLENIDGKLLIWIQGNETPVEIPVSMKGE